MGQTNVATSAGFAERGADNDTDDTTWYQAAIEAARADISAVTGSGAVRGVWFYDGAAYAFRDNGGGTACIMWKSSSTGWVEQDLGHTIAFTSGGATEIVEGNVITGAVSGAYATIGRVVLESGTWGAGTAAGRFSLLGKTGTFIAENLNVGSSANLATIAGDATAHSFPAGGHYEFVNHNFTGDEDRLRMYGCNGVGTAFEWDGTTFVKIVTGMDADTPDHIAVHKNHLFLSFPGGSNQHSGVGAPYDWSIVSGAGELSIGEDVTGYVQGFARSLVIFGRNKICQLSGDDSSSWVLDTLAEDAGGVEWTAQKIGVPIYMDDRGLRSLVTTQAYGDFKVGAVTQACEPFLRAKRAAGVTPNASVRVRGKDQYRLFYSDGSGLSVYFGRKAPEILPFNPGRTINCACSGEDEDGNEIVLLGATNGYVYEADAGTSFDGDEVSAYLRLPFNHVGSPTQDKRWHKASLEMDSTGAVSVGMTAEFSYANPETSPATQQTFNVYGGGGFWDEMNWDEFYWSSPVEGLAECHIDGIGTNLSLAVISQATYEEPHTLHGLTLHYSYRRLRR